MNINDNNNSDNDSDSDVNKSEKTNNSNCQNYDSVGGEPDNNDLINNNGDSHRGRLVTKMEIEIVVTPEQYTNGLPRQFEHPPTQLYNFIILHVHSTTALQLDGLHLPIYD